MGRSLVIRFFRVSEIMVVLCVIIHDMIMFIVLTMSIVIICLVAPPDIMAGLKLAIHGAGYPLPGGYDVVAAVYVLNQEWLWLANDVDGLSAIP